MSIQFRPVGDFLDLSSFKVPSGGDLQDRLSVNLNYYLGNYLLIAALFILFLCVQSPSLLFAVLAIGAAGIYLFSLRKDAIIVGGKVFNNEEIRLIYIATAALLFVYVGGYPVLYVTAVAALIALAHASLRQRSIKSRANNTINNIKAAKRDL